MSAFLDIADSIKTRLDAQTGMSGVDVIVERQQDVGSMVARAIAKHAGQGAAIITWTGGRNSDPMMAPPRFSVPFLITLFSKPVIRDGQTAADDIVETICYALHLWNPDADAHCYEDITVDGITLLDAGEKLLVHQIALSVTIQIQTPS